MFAHGQKGDVSTASIHSEGLIDSEAYTQTVSPGDNTWPGAESDVYDCL